MVQSQNRDKQLPGGLRESAELILSSHCILVGSVQSNIISLRKNKFLSISK